MMKNIWGFFTSTRLTVLLTILIVVDVFIGSVLLSYFPEDLGTIDLEIFFQWLLRNGMDKPILTWWIFLLLFLLLLFAVNTALCSIDSVASLFSTNQCAGKTKFRRLLSQIIHLGFIIALIGHLLSSASGFRTVNNYLVEGESIAVPYQRGLSLRLDKLDVGASHGGNMERMDARISLVRDSELIKDKVVRPNNPLIYKNIAVYLAHHGDAPMGMKFNLKGNGVSDTIQVMFRKRDETTFKDFRVVLGPFVPDFAVDKEGRVYSASREFRNPAQKIEIYRKEMQNL